MKSSMRSARKPRPAAPDSAGKMTPEEIAAELPAFAMTDQPPFGSRSVVLHLFPARGRRRRPIGAEARTSEESPQRELRDFGGDAR